MTKRHTLYDIVENVSAEREIMSKIELDEDTKKMVNYNFESVDINERTEVSMRYHLNFY